MLKVLILALALAFVSPAFAQTTVVVEPTFADQAWGWLLTVATGAVPILTGFLAKMLWSQSRLAAILFSQAMLDKLNAGIIAFIRAEVERRRLAKPAALTAKAEAMTAAVPLTVQAKEEVVAAVQPKVEAAFKETLAHFDKKPGSEAVRDMIFGRLNEALAKPLEVPHVLSK